MSAWLEHSLADNPGEDGAAEASAEAAERELVAMGVGAIMALHSVDKADATSALSRVASHFQVPVAAVAHAVLTLVAGGEEELGDMAGRAATQLLLEGLTSST